MSIITLKQKRELLSSAFGEGIVSSNGKDVAVYCPVCLKSPKVKKKKKLSICIETGVYHCWVCETKGKNIARFVQVNYPNNKQIDRFKEYFGGFKEEVLQQEISLKLPDDFKLLATSRSKQSNFIKDYLFKRGFNEDDLFRFKAGFSFEPGFENRVIFPSFDENLNLNFYLTRVCEKTKYQQYKNCKASKRDIIFNEHSIEWDRPVIIVEGIFDSLKAGSNSVPILGSWIDEKYKLFRKIIESNASVVLALDPDVQEKQMKIAKRLINYGINVSYVSNIQKDLGDMTKKEAQSCILNAKPFDNMERMRYLISGIKSGSMY